MDFLKGLKAKIGDGIRDTAKLTTNTAEWAVQKSGVGKVSEKLGFKVESDIHQKGFQSTVTGPAARVATGFKGDKVEVKVKAASGGGDFRAETSGKAYCGSVKIG